MNEINKELENVLRKNLNSINWKKIIVIFSISRDEIGFVISYINNNNEFEKLRLRTKILGFYLDFLHPRFLDKLNNSRERFNKLTIEIFPNGTYNKNYFWDDKKENQDKIDSASIFYQWLNETLMNRIFDYEKEQGLLTPVLDDDGEFDYHESSWDKGEFKFKILQNKITHSIILLKDGISRVLNMPLPEYIISGILEHHQITNQELTQAWRPWNTLTIKSPHNDIPYDDWENYVNYMLDSSIA